jgi:hypothetical protein
MSRNKSAGRKFGMPKLVKQAPANNLSDCLFLDIDSVAAKKRRVRLQVTAHFNEHHIQHQLGTFAIALRGGDLRLDLYRVEFCKHLKYGNLNVELRKIGEQAESQATKRSRENISSSAVAGQAGVTGPKLSSSLGKKLSLATADEVAHGTTQRVEYRVFQLNALNGVRPGWRFKLKTDEEFLEGSINSLNFCECDVTSTPAQIDARFEVLSRDVRMHVLSGLLLSKGIYGLLNPQKRKVFNLLLWKRVVKPKFEPYLSRVVLSYE